MIIQCEQCQTRFKLDDAKIRGRGVKVRCAKCRHVFQVHAESPPVTEFSDLLEQYADASPPPVPEMPDLSVPAAAAGGSLTGQPEPASFGVIDSTGTLPGADGGHPAANELSDTFDICVGGTESELPSVVAMDSELIRTADGPVLLQDVPATDNTGADDGAINFGELNFDTDAVSGGTPASADKTGEDHFQLDFGDLSDSGRAGSGPGETSSLPDDFTNSLFSSVPAPTGMVEGEDSSGFDFSDLDLGELPPAAKVAVEQVPSGEKPEAFARVADPLSSAGPSGTGVQGEESVDELPPLVISSRRKGPSLFPAVVIIAAILFVCLLAGVGFFVLSGPDTAKKMGLGFIATLTGADAKEEGAISLGKVTAQFATNKEAGELFVIRGEAVNNFSKPRASIQVKATLHGAGGQPLVSKAAYCGNNLTSEQLETLPLTKIDEVMNNQFGDSLSNLGVQPGKTIPFVVVFGNAPKDAADFSVVVAGSTVAAK